MCPNPLWAEARHWYYRTQQTAEPMPRGKQAREIKAATGALRWRSFVLQNNPDPARGRANFNRGYAGIRPTNNTGRIVANTDL